MKEKNSYDKPIQLFIYQYERIIFKVIPPDGSFFLDDALFASTLGPRPVSPHRSIVSIIWYI